MKKQALEYTVEELLSLIKKTFGDRYEGEYVLIRLGEKPDACLYNLYANPVETPSIAINPAIRDGFKFEIHNNQQERILLDTPEDAYDILLLINNTEFAIKKIYRKVGPPAAAVEQNLLIIKKQENYPTNKEIQNAFKTKPTNISVKNNQITQQKTTTRPTNLEEQKQSQITKKLKPKFKKIQK